MPKYTIHRSVYLKGKFIHATPDSPAEIELTEAEAKQDGLHPGVKGPLVLKPHYVDNREASSVPTAADVQSKPLAEQQKGKRPSDASPA